MYQKHDFVKDTILKQPTERNLYQKARYNYGIHGDVVTVAGPDVLRHILCSRETVACTPSSRVRVIEIDHKVHMQQKETMDEMYRRPRVLTWQSTSIEGSYWEPGEMFPIGYNVDFTYGNIADEKPALFMDADLTATTKNSGPDLIRTLRNQREAFPLGTSAKAFIFTFGIRSGGGLSSDLNWVTRELIPTIGSACVIGSKETITKDRDTRRSKSGYRGIVNQKFQFVSASRPEILHDITMYTYHDGGGPMLTGMLIYS